MSGEEELPGQSGPRGSGPVAQAWVLGILGLLRLGIPQSRETLSLSSGERLAHPPAPLLRTAAQAWCGMALSGQVGAFGGFVARGFSCILMDTGAPCLDLKAEGGFHRGPERPPGTDAEGNQQNPESVVRGNSKLTQRSVWLSNSEPVWAGSDDLVMERAVCAQREGPAECGSQHGILTLRRPLTFTFLSRFLSFSIRFFLSSKTALLWDQKA
ncbi:uncharacterized protein LOC116420157 [Sarcophilus harrisii]|uniref:uncharacterized protein LOC116420157 n=1 Tax=Sarcophilus harrisii TaxID=9305 RepID=UPI001301D689|nr:uncharacterized protein LOC116420157 [Sarcophilus harrisii]